MARYTRKNLKADVEDSAAGSAMSPGLEARFAREVLECASFGLSYQRLAPGFRMPFGHTHRTQEEAYVVLSGGGRMKLDDDVVELRPWDAVRVSPETARALEAGPEGLEVLVFGAPRSPQGVQDAQLIQGWWDD